jgi:ABC-type transport system involved in multi-copper enzyme maturation permease subunit
VSRIPAIAWNTFRESIRDRILYNLILFALIMIFSALALGQLTLGHENKVVIDLGLTSISVFGTLIAIFIGIGLVYKELEKRTVYALLSKPVHRHEFILGKYFGLLITLLVNVAVMTLFLMITLLYQGGLDLQGYASLIPAVYLIYLSLALTTALALVFSTFSTPVLSAVFTLFLWVIGRFNSDLLDFGRLTESRAIERLTGVMYYVLPNFRNFTNIDSRNVIQSAAYFQPLNPAAIGWASLYGLLYCALLLALAIMIFTRRDFK